jgi:hypothetical protein
LAATLVELLAVLYSLTRDFTALAGGRIGSLVSGALKFDALGVLAFLAIRRTCLAVVLLIGTAFYTLAVLL